MPLTNIESLPEHCLELIFDYLNLDDFNNVIKCCKRFENIGKEVRRMREIRLHQVFRQEGGAKWELLHPPAAAAEGGCADRGGCSSPGRRFGSTLVFYGGAVYLFGGATVNWTTFNDLWRFDLGGRRWSRRMVRGTCPPPRASASGILLRGGRLLIIGGFEVTYSIHAKNTSNWDNLPWVYDFTLNEWSMMMVDTSLLPIVDDIDCSSRKFALSPTPVGQSFCLMMSDQIIMFGGAKVLLNQSQGYHRKNPIHPTGLSNDTLSLSISTSVLSPINTFGDERPFKRCGHSAMAIDSHRMLILGGNRGPNTKGTEDMWLLTCVESLRPPHVFCCRLQQQQRNEEVLKQADSRVCCWYWTRVMVSSGRDSLVQPLPAFLNNCTVFTGNSGAMSTLIVLGGGTDSVELAMTTAVQSSEQIQLPRKSGRLIVHSIDLSRLHLQDDTGDETVMVTSAEECRAVRWTAPLAQSQHLEGAPSIKQAFGMALGDDCLFLYGGLCYQSVYSRPVSLPNDLMARDSDEEKVTANMDLHQLTFSSRAISL